MRKICVNCHHDLKDGSCGWCLDTDDDVTESDIIDKHVERYKELQLELAEEKKESDRFHKITCKRAVVISNQIADIRGLKSDLDEAKSNIKMILDTNKKLRETIEDLKDNSPF